MNFAPETAGSREITHEDVTPFFLGNRSGTETLSAMVEAEVSWKAGTSNGNYLVPQSAFALDLEFRQDMRREIWEIWEAS